MTILLAKSPFIIALFEYDFLLYAMIAGLVLGFITPIIGSFVIIRRLSLIANTLSHFSLAGLTAGLFLMNTVGLAFLKDPLYLAVIASVIGAIIIEILRGYYQNYKEISMPIVISLGIALSALFISLAGGWNSSIYNYLFGSLLTVRANYLILISTTTIVVLTLVIIFYKRIVLISFDEAYAKLVGIKIGRFQIVSTLILALVVSLSIVTVGVLLVSSLMIIPVAAAMKVGKSFKNTITIAIFFSELSVIFGMWFSYRFNIPPGATIVLINILILFLTGFFKQFVVNKRLKSRQQNIQTKELS
jgi:zinc transport system permease protein